MQIVVVGGQPCLGIAAVARVHDHDLLQSAGMAVGRSATDYAEVLVVTRSAIRRATARAPGRTRHNPAPGIIHPYAELGIRSNPCRGPGSSFEASLVRV